MRARKGVSFFNLEKKGAYYTDEQIRDVLMQEPYSSANVNYVVQRSRYKDEIQAGWRILRRAELLTKENQEAVVLSFKNAELVATALELLDDNNLLTEENRETIVKAGVYANKVAKSLVKLNKHKLLPNDERSNKIRAAIIQNAQYTDYVVEILLLHQRSGNLITDQTLTNIIEEITDKEKKAIQVFNEFKLNAQVPAFVEAIKKNEALKAQSYDVTLFAKRIIELQPVSYQFMHSLSDDERFILIRDLCETIVSEFKKEKNENNYASNVALLKSILKIDPQLLNQRNFTGNFLLSRAVTTKNIDLLNLLIECGADVNQTVHGRTVMQSGIYFYSESDPDYIKKLQEIPALQKVDSTMIERNTQTNIISTAKALGYSSEDKGVCLGYAVMGMQAFLLEDELGNPGAGLEAFEDRAIKMALISPEKHAENVKKARKKIQSDQAVDLTEDEKFSNEELPAFFEGVELYQKTDTYDSFYPKEKAPILHQMPEPSLKLAASQQLENQGGVVSVKRFSGVYDEGEFHQYLVDLKKTTALKPVGLLLSANEHTIFVGLDPKKNRFVLINANRAEVSKRHIQYFDTVGEIETNIKNALVFKDKFCLETTVFSSEKNQLTTEAQCENWLKKLKDIHKVTPEKLSYSQFAWWNKALKQGEVELMEKMKKVISIFYKSDDTLEKDAKKSIDKTKKINTLRK